MLGFLKRFWFIIVWMVFKYCVEFIENSNRILLIGLTILLIYITTEFVDSFEWTTGFGAKSIGEASLIGAAPAIQNAVYNAVGVRINTMPITAEKILKALEEKKEASKSKD